jgi:hypothetical protein
LRELQRAGHITPYPYKACSGHGFSRQFASPFRSLAVSFLRRRAGYQMLNKVNVVVFRTNSWRFERVYVQGKTPRKDSLSEQRGLELSQSALRTCVEAGLLKPRAAGT